MCVSLALKMARMIAKHLSELDKWVIVGVAWKEEGA